MSFFGRSLSADKGWSKRHRFLVSFSLVLAPCHVASVVGLLLMKSYELAVLEAAGVAFVLVAVFSGLPRATPAAAPPPRAAMYREGPAVPAIEPPRPSLTFMEVVLSLFLALHALAVIAAVVMFVGVLLVLGLVAFLCSKH